MSAYLILISEILFYFVFGFYFLIQNEFTKNN